MSMPAPDDGDLSARLSKDAITQLLDGVESGPAAPAPSALLSSAVVRRLSIGRKQTDILTAFDDMSVPPALVEQLRPLFDESGLTLTKSFVVDPFNLKKARAYTAAHGADIEVVVLHLENWVMLTSDAVAFLLQSTKNIQDRHVRIISEGLDAPAYGYDVTLQSVSERQTNKLIFIPWGFVRQALDGQIKLDKALQLPPITPAANSNKPAAVAPPPPLQVDHDRLEEVVDILVLFADQDPSFLTGLITAEPWPKGLVTQANARLKAGNTPEDQAWGLINLLVVE